MNKQYNSRRKKSRNKQYKGPYTINKHVKRYNGEKLGKSRMLETINDLVFQEISGKEKILEVLTTINEKHVM